MAADELYDGPFCILSIVDSKRQRRLDYEVLHRAPTQEDIQALFLRVEGRLARRGLKVLGVTTDGSQLYPEPLQKVWPNAVHQVCQFHVLKDITRAILRALARMRRQLTRQVPKLPRGRPSTREQKRLARKAERLRAQVTDLFDHRHLFVQKDLTPVQSRIVRRLARRHPDLRALRQIMDEVYRLFDRRCRTETALAKLSRLRRKLTRFKSLGRTLAKLHSPNLEKALTFLDDKELEATSNSVERANRRHRKMQKSIYRVRTQQSLRSRIALDMFRDQGLPDREALLATLHAGRLLTVGGMGP